MISAGSRKCRAFSARNLLLIPPLLLIAFEGELPFRTHPLGGTMTAEHSTASTAGNVLMSFLAYAWLIPLLATSARRIWSVLVENRGYSCTILYALCSVGWSQDPLRTVTHWGALALTVALAAYLAACLEQREQQSLLVGVGLATAVASIVAGLIVPQYANAYVSGHLTLRGVFPTKNVMGGAMLMCLTPIPFMGRSEVRRHPSAIGVLYAGIMIAALYLSTSVTSEVCVALFVLSMLVVRLIRMGNSYRERLIIFAIISSILILTVAICIGNLSSLLALMHKDITLSGRTAIWATALRSISKHLLCGYGYNAFWGRMSGEAFNIYAATGWAVSYGHNGLVDICLELGIVGVAMVLVVIYQSLHSIVRLALSNRLRAVEWYAQVLIVLVCYNMAEVRFLAPNDLITMLGAMAIFSIRKHCRSMHREQIIVCSGEAA